MYRLVFSLLLFVWLSSCGSNDKSNTDCTAPKPEAIFNKKNTQIISQNFFSKGQESTEQVQFDNGVTLNLYQSGCQKIVQEFVFDIPSEFGTQKEYTDLAIEQMNFISKLDDNFFAYSQWAEAIKVYKDAFKTTTEIEVSPGFNVFLDHIDGVDKKKVIVRLSQK